VRKGEKEIEVFRSNQITDVAILGNKMMIQLCEPSNVYNSLDSIFGYTIVLDTTGTSAQLNKIPPGIQ
jgi:hypothetical protein